MHNSEIITYDGLKESMITIENLLSLTIEVDNRTYKPMKMVTDTESVLYYPTFELMVYSTSLPLVVNVVIEKEPSQVKLIVSNRLIAPLQAFLFAWYSVGIIFQFLLVRVFIYNYGTIDPALYLALFIPVSVFGMTALIAHAIRSESWSSFLEQFQKAIDQQILFNNKSDSEN